MEYSFNTNIATQYDVDIAIFLNNLKFWTLRNLANNKHIHDGLCWSYNTIPGFCDMFKFWSRHQIEHLIRKMKTAGLIATGNYNSSKYDRTCWYALTLKGLSLFPELLEESYIVKLYESISENSEMQNLNPAWCENEDIDLGKFRDEVLKIPRPIPDINTDSKQDISKDISNTPPKPVSHSIYTLKELILNNPHEIPQHMLEDFMTNRKAKKAKVTRTAWEKINKTLIQIDKELGIKPVTAFETMVANCWQSLDVKYFKDDEKRKGNASPKQDYV